MMKRCPFCAEDIRAAAIICRFCNRDLPAPAAVDAVDPAVPASRTPAWLAPPITEPCPVCGGVLPDGAAEVLRAAALSAVAGAPSARRARDWTGWAFAVCLLVLVAAVSIWMVALTGRPATTVRPDATSARRDGPAGSNRVETVPGPDGDHPPPASTAAQPPRAESSVRAEDLVAAYQRNGIAADRLYKGRVVDISGPVGWVGTDVFGNPYVTLGRDATMGVQAMFASGSDAVLATLAPDQPIVVRCRVEGRLVSVVARDCRLQ